MDKVGEQRNEHYCGSAWTQDQVEASGARDCDSPPPRLGWVGRLSPRAAAEGGVTGSAWQPAVLEEFGGYVFGQRQKNLKERRMLWE